MEKLTWPDKLRYCGMSKSPTARNLYRKARSSRRLSQTEIETIEKIGCDMARTVGTSSKTMRVDMECLPDEIEVPDYMLLYDEKAVLVMRSSWLVDRISGRVVGKHSGVDTLTLLPNPIVKVDDLARMLWTYSLTF